MHILLLEDDRILSSSLKEYLELSHYTIDIVDTEAKVFDATYLKSYQLYIFDINLANSNSGLSILKTLRESDDNTPVIFISALTDMQSISTAFKIGAEDYIKKPFDPEELLLRIQNKFQLDNEITIQNLTYNPTTRMIKKGDSLLILGTVQANIFHLLMIHKNHIVPTDELLELLENPTINALRVNLTKIKLKLAISIINIRNQGYMIEDI